MPAASVDLISVASSPDAAPLPRASGRTETGCSTAPASPVRAETGLTAVQPRTEPSAPSATKR